MTSLPTSPLSADASTRIWALDADALHDRYWFAQGVHVVRPGGQPIPREHAPRFMLVNQRTFVVGALPTEATTLHRGDPVVIEMLVHHEPTDVSGFAETVTHDDDGVRVRRAYDAPPPTPQGCVWLTNDRSLAELWRGSAGDEHAERVLMSRGRTLTRSQVAITGRVLTRGTDESALRSHIASVWDPDTVPEFTLRSIEPGVWSERTARIAPDARFVPPVWIGSGVEIEAGEVVVGPCVIPDREARHATDDWGPLPALQTDTRDVLGRVGRTDGVRPHPRLRRIFDIAFATTALLITLPLFPIIMALIFIEDGRPFFFGHERQSLGGRVFRCFKFRTMCRDAERMKADLAAANCSDGPQFHIPHDPRLLRIGRFLRKVHLDELPQFWNVLRGDMAIVGPRPSPDKENQYCPAWREARLSVLPGVTGLWQVCRTRAPNCDFQEWIRFDMEYVRSRTWRMDLWIIWMTVRRIFGS